VHTIVQMARSLELEVIAEGVETQWQWDTLIPHGCDQYQGYLFGRPVPIEVFERESAASAA
jgi:EAL domain-containing protein (putative c-di-GMP-specific phosphodiesterase class I)